MSDAYSHFRAACERLRPSVAVVLGSGLGSILARVRPEAEVAFAQIPGFPAPTVAGHSGKLVVGHWGTQIVLLFQGRTHFYEGHAWDRVTAGVNLAADLGVRTLLLTNAAGGIHPTLHPGELMVLSRHAKLIGPRAWASFGEEPSPYSPELVAKLQALSGARPLLAGCYAALTGPCYETPAEIRALKISGADAVGMSTAIEAEAAAARGLAVAAISCITNAAAGLGDGPLDHREVLANAAAPAERLGNLFGSLIGA